LPDSAKNEIKQTTELQAKEIQSGDLEGSGKVEIKPDSAAATQLPGANTTIVQTTTGNRFAGRFTGTETAVSGCPESPSTKISDLF